MLTAHNRRVEWDPISIREIEEAKIKYQEARLASREIVLDNDIPLEYFDASLGHFIVKSPKLTESQFEMRVFDESGDRLITFDSNNLEEVANAARLFNEYLQKGWRAYAIGADGKKSRRLFGFNGDSQEILFDEKSTKERLKDFVKSFRQVQMTPKTRPG